MTLFRKTKKKTKIRGKKGFHVISSVSNSNEIYEQFGDVKVKCQNENPCEIETQRMTGQRRISLYTE